jgi:hypothetical protein
MYGRPKAILYTGGVILIGEVDWRTLDEDKQVMSTAGEDPDEPGYHSGSNSVE